MISVESLMWGIPYRRVSPDLDFNPLMDPDILREAQVLDVRVHALTSRVGILFEMRTTLHFEESAAALIVISGVHGLRWVADRGHDDDGKFTAWTVVSSEPCRTEDKFVFSLSCLPAAQLTVEGGGASFYVLGSNDVVDECPPDYSEVGIDGVRQGVVGWDSKVVVLQDSSI